MRTKLKIVSIVLLAALLTVSIVAANTFYFIWIETPFEPNVYNWNEPWQVKEMVDFVEATLTLTGCSYQGQSHDVELIITNVANSPNFYLMSFSYLATWYVDAEHQETIIAGSYTDDPLAIDSFVTYLDTWIPTLIGDGEIQLDIIDIAWARSETITWTTVINNQNLGYCEISSFVIEGATKTFLETGTAVIYFTATGPLNFDLTIPEIGTQHFEGITESPFTYEFGPLTIGGDLTATLTIPN